MKVIFNCILFDYHRQHCLNIVKEIENRGGIAIMTDSLSNNETWANRIKYEDKCIEKYSDFDCTVIFDEHNRRIGGFSVYMNHGYTTSPQVDFYLHNKDKKYKEGLIKSSDYIFAQSEIIKNYYHDYTGIKTFNVGFPLHDSLINKEQKRDKILFAPTHYAPRAKPTSCYYNMDIPSLKNYCKSYGELIVKAHPLNIAKYKRRQDDSRPGISTWEFLKDSSIVITDYSSIGYSALALNIPTILIDSKYWREEIKNYNHPVEKLFENARNASIRCLTQDDVHKAIKTYKDNPKYLETERLKVSKSLNSNLGNSAKVFVDQLEILIKQHKK